MPILGLGTWSDPESGGREKTSQAVYDAINRGYRHIDTAFCYKVEDKVGLGIKRAIDEGIVRREELFVVTKIWVTNMRREALIAQAKGSLASLGLTYVDCLLVHFPTAIKDNGKGQHFPADDEGKGCEDDVDINTETWPAMEEVLAMGLTKSIGVSNYNCRQIQELMKVAKVPPVTNQVESTPFLPQHKLMKTCREFGITLTAYSPFGGGTERGLSKEHNDFDVRTSLFENEAIQKIAQTHGKNVSQILLKFHVQRGVIVIPKSVTRERIISNSDIFDFELTPDDMRILGSLDNGQRSVNPPEIRTCKNYPFNED